MGEKVEGLKDSLLGKRKCRRKGPGTGGHRERKGQKEASMARAPLGEGRREYAYMWLERQEQTHEPNTTGSQQQNK